MRVYSRMISGGRSRSARCKKKETPRLCTVVSLDDRLHALHGQRDIDMQMRILKARADALLWRYAVAPVGKKIFALGGLMVWCFISSSLLSAPPDPQWTTHSDPGYSVQLPPGWTVSPDRQKGWVHLVGTQGEDIVIWPVFIPGAVLDLRAAQSIYLKLTAAYPYHADWEAPQPVGPSTLRARGKSQNMTAISVFTWMASPRGTAAYFYVAGARATDFRQKQGDLAKILGSFRLVGEGSAAPAAGLQFVPFADPREGAFTVDVPAGWNTSGGLFRASPFVTHWAIETDSPDGQTRVVMGDPLLPTSFQQYLPGAPPWAVQPEGTNVLGNIVHRYMTGGQYCQYYVQSRIPSFWSDLQMTGSNDNPPELMALALSRDPTLANTQFTIGSLSFTCLEQGRPKTGYCVALTKISIRPPQIQLPYIGWRVDALLGYIAPPEGIAQAEAVMLRLRDSVRVNTDWGMREIQAAGAKSRIISGATQEIAGMAESSQRYRDAVDDRIARLRSNATLGVADVMDPATGRHMTVDSGAGYYWVDQRGVIVGTNTDTRPNVDFRALVQLP